jgi:1-acyl-sn-glycerol-3-phosphate acyltransferase
MTGHDGSPANAVRHRMWLWWPSAELMTLIYRLVFRIRVTGKEPLPRTGAVLIVCNHLSNLDPPMVGWASRPRKSYYMAKKELFAKRIGAWIISSLGAFPVDRGGMDRNAIRISRDLLERGESVKLSGFGNFQLRDKPQRPGRNPKTGEAVALSGKYVPHFKPGKDLRERVNEGQDHPIRD